MHQVLLPENVPFDSSTFSPGSHFYLMFVSFVNMLSLLYIDMEEEEEEEINLFK